MPKKLTIRDLFEAKKQKKQLIEVRTDCPLEAKACEEAGVDMIMALREALPQVRPAAPNTFIITADGVQDPQISRPHQAVAAGFRCMNEGGDAVYTSLSLKCVKAMAQEKIPVIGHVGYVPYRQHWTGGPRAIGKTAVEAEQVYRDVLAYQEAGAIGVEMEIVPARVLDEIAKRTDILIMSMGAGTGGIAQYLFAEDILGLNTGHIPRHAKVYANLLAEYERIQKMRVEAFRELKDDVTTGGYPEQKHLLKIKDSEFDAFLSAID